MPDCNYCDDSFDDEDTYLEHLSSEHDREELSRIDQRRVDSHFGDDGSDIPTGPLILGGLILIAAIVVVYVTFIGFGGGGSGAGSGIRAVATQPTNTGGPHEHGEINVTIDGQTIDFSQPQYQNPRENPSFHFEGGNGDVWHKHANRVTLEYAMSTLGIHMNSTAVQFNGELYRDSDPGTTVRFEVNGQPVDPQTYKLQGAPSAAQAAQGDRIHIVVQTNDSG